MAARESRRFVVDHHDAELVRVVGGDYVLYWGVWASTPLREGDVLAVSVEEERSPSFDADDHAHYLVTRAVKPNAHAVDKRFLTVFVKPFVPDDKNRVTEYADFYESANHPDVNGVVDCIDEVFSHLTNSNTICCFCSCFTSAPDFISVCTDFIVDMIGSGAVWYGLVVHAYPSAPDLCGLPYQENYTSKETQQLLSRLLCIRKWHAHHPIKVRIYAHRY